MRKLLMVAVVVACVAGFMYAQEEDANFGFEQAFYLHFKQSKLTPTDEQVEAYIRNILQNDYQRMWQNEFDRRKLIQQANERIKQGIEAFDMAKEYWIVSEVKFDDYDFKREGFAIPYLNSTDVGNRNMELALVVSNGDNFKFLPMKPDDADTWLKSRTDGWNQIRRNVLVITYFKIGPNTKEWNNKIVRSSRYDPTLFLEGIVNRVDVYDQYYERVVGTLVK